MLRVLASRLLYTLPVLWLVVSAVFLLIHLVPGDPVQQMLGESAAPADLAATRHAYGLDLPLGATNPLGFSAMINLIGTVPATRDVLAIPGAHLHLYRKAPKPGRKLGHITIVADNPEEREARLEELMEWVEAE